MSDETSITDESVMGFKECQNVPEGSNSWCFHTMQVEMHVFETGPLYACFCCRKGRIPLNVEICGGETVHHADLRSNP